MTETLPAQRVAKLLETAKYRPLALPLQIAGLEFHVAGAFVGVDRSSDLVVIGDMAEGERKVVAQIEGIARALDVMRSRRPLTAVIVGPRPVGKVLDALSQVSRMLAVDEASVPAELRDRMAILLPLKLPSTLGDDRDLDAHKDLDLPEGSFAMELAQAAARGETAVREHFHGALNAIFADEEAEDVWLDLGGEDEQEQSP